MRTSSNVFCNEATRATEESYLACASSSCCCATTPCDTSLRIRSRFTRAFSRSAFATLRLASARAISSGREPCTSSASFASRFASCPLACWSCARYSSSSSRTSTCPCFTESPLSTPIHATLPITLEASSILCAATIYPVALRITPCAAALARGGGAHALHLHLGRGVQFRVDEPRHPEQHEQQHAGDDPPGSPRRGFGRALFPVDA